MYSPSVNYVVGMKTEFPLVGFIRNYSPSYNISLEPARQVPGDWRPEQNHLQLSRITECDVVRASVDVVGMFFVHFEFCLYVKCCNFSFFLLKLLLLHVLKLTSRLISSILPLLQLTVNMRLEIHSAADFLVHLLRLHHNGLTESQLELFKVALSNLLRLRYRDHWFPDKPNRGSGYRCLRINGKMDPVIAQAGAAVGLPVTYLRNLFPSELTMWIDPAEVSYRIGENGSICVLYETLNQPESKMVNAVQCNSPDYFLEPSHYERFDPVYGYLALSS